VVAAVVSARTGALGGPAAGSPAMVDGLRWGLLACVAFVVLSLIIVLPGLWDGHQSQEAAP